MRIFASFLIFSFFFFIHAGNAKPVLQEREAPRSIKTRFNLKSKQQRDPGLSRKRPHTVPLPPLRLTYIKEKARVKRAPSIQVSPHNRSKPKSISLRPTSQPQRMKQAVSKRAPLPRVRSSAALPQKSTTNIHPVRNQRKTASVPIRRSVLSRETERNRKLTRKPSPQEQARIPAIRSLSSKTSLQSIQSQTKREELAPNRIPLEQHPLQAVTPEERRPSLPQARDERQSTKPAPLRTSVTEAREKQTSRRHTVKGQKKTALVSDQLTRPQAAQRRQTKATRERPQETARETLSVQRRATTVKQVPQPQREELTPQDTPQTNTRAPLQVGTEFTHRLRDLAGDLGPDLLPTQPTKRTSRRKAVNQTVQRDESYWERWMQHYQIPRNPSLTLEANVKGYVSFALSKMASYLCDEESATQWRQSAARFGSFQSHFEPQDPYIIRAFIEDLIQKNVSWAKYWRIWGFNDKKYGFPKNPSAARANIDALVNRGDKQALHMKSYGLANNTFGYPQDSAAAVAINDQLVEEELRTLMTRPDYESGRAIETKVDGLFHGKHGYPRDHNALRIFNDYLVSKREDRAIFRKVEGLSEGKWGYPKNPKAAVQFNEELADLWEDVAIAIKYYGLRDEIFGYKEDKAAAERYKQEIINRKGDLVFRGIWASRAESKSEDKRWAAYKPDL